MSDFKERIKRGGIQAIEAFEELKKMLGKRRIYFIDDQGEKYELIDYDWEYAEGESAGYVIPLYKLKLKKGAEVEWKWLDDVQWWLLKGGSIEVSELERNKEENLDQFIEKAKKNTPSTKRGRGKGNSPSPSS